MRERTYNKPKKISEYVVTSYDGLIDSVDEYVRCTRSYKKALNSAAALVDFQAVFKDGLRYSQLIYRCDDGRYRKFVTSCEFVEGSIRDFPAKIRVGEFHERARLVRESEARKYYHLHSIT